MAAGQRDLLVLGRVLQGQQKDVGFRGLGEVRFSFAIQRRKSQNSYGKFTAIVVYFEKARKWAFTETYTIPQAQEEGRSDTQHSG